MVATRIGLQSTCVAFLFPNGAVFVCLFVCLFYSCCYLLVSDTDAVLYCEHLNGYCGQHSTAPYIDEPTNILRVMRRYDKACERFSLIFYRTEGEVTPRGPAVFGNVIE